MTTTTRNYDTTAYDRLVGGLHGAGCRVVDRGDSARAACPAHGSTGLTLALRRDGDRARVHCFAGCADTEVLDVLGMKVADLFDAPPTPGYRPPRPEPTAYEAAMTRIGITDPPPVEHLLHRCEQQATKEALGLERGFEDGPATAMPDTCATCGTPVSPWSCSCGQTRRDGTPDLGGAA